MHALTFTKVRKVTEEGCIECAKETIRYMDSDGTEFCSKRCIEAWHGIANVIPVGA